MVIQFSKYQIKVNASKDTYIYTFKYYYSESMSSLSYRFKKVIETLVYIVRINLILNIYTECGRSIQIKTRCSRIGVSLKCYIYICAKAHIIKCVHHIPILSTFLDTYLIHVFARIHIIFVVNFIIYFCYFVAV